MSQRLLASALSGKKRAALCAMIGLSLPMPSTMSLQAQAQIISTIQIPPNQAIVELSTVQSLHELTLANLAASNCDIANLTSGDAALIAGTAQAVAAHMGISMDVYMADYLQSAMKELSTPDACANFTDKTLEIADRVKALGGIIIGQ